MRLAFASHVDALAEEAARLGDAAANAWGLAVPSCPGWQVEDLLEHLAEVYRFWGAQLTASDPDEPTESPPASEEEPKGIEITESLALSLARSLEELGPEVPCWNFTGAELQSSFVARRMALETAVHRVDIELALGKARPIETELAVDGIEERFETFLARRLAVRSEIELGGTLCLIAKDIDAAYRVEVVRGRFRWRSGRGPADSVLVGTASELLLFTWNRLSLDSLELTGEAGVAQAFSELPG